ncbi:MAG TPA: bis-aminopropyl spermidine synthase family protein, partial [Acidimicrobiales bacterium]|nr:bis-aminopropyl spermidine synthase family protein [Acidimicrobiales bacterium]
MVDIDEPILDHVSQSADGIGLSVTAAWADLRLALPPSLVGTADLVFTDPPYTTEGMRLFLVRALEALRPTGHERLAFCFGTGERHLVKALEVQSLLGELRLALEAMLPGFNHYDGAEAIGARSDLYICRPTRGARVGGAGRSTRSKKSPSRIYTRGPSAEEAAGPSLADPVKDAALAAVPEGQLLLVGDGWDAPALSLPDFFSRVAAWATAARPGPFPFSGTPVINTAPDHGGAAVRTLLLAAPERAVLILPRRDLFDDALLGAAYDVAPVPAGPGGDPAVLLATRHDRVPVSDAEAVLRHVLLHPGAKIVNAWRDGLLAVARAAGTTMTKNEARARIAADSLDPAV